MSIAESNDCIVLPYGRDSVGGAMPRGRCLGVLDVAELPACDPLDEAFERALRHPIGQDRPVLDGIYGGDSVTIVVSDAFRKTAIDRLLPYLLDGLCGRGIAEADIAFLVATGSHRPPRPDELSAILGPEVYQRFERQVFVHDPHDAAGLVDVGTTRRGTPVRINRRAVQTDRLIVTGAVVLHYFGGFGGGRKAILPGLAAIETIAHNHARNLHPTEDRLDPAVRIAALEGNPVAEDMLDGARMVPVHALLNTLLNARGEIAGIFVGDLELAHAAAAQAAYQAFAVRIAEQADIVVAASAATKNFVQTHKALFNAYQAMKPGGRIVLAAPCPEGLGGEQFTKWLRLGAPDIIMRELRQRAEINGQTALSTRQKAPNMIMVTELSDDEVDALGARKAPTLDDALREAVAHCASQGNSTPTYYKMPNAAYTVPVPIP